MDMNKSDLINKLKPTYDIHTYLFKTAQKDEEFFTGKIKAGDLIKLATVNVRTNDINEKNYINEIEEQLKYDLDGEPSSIIKLKPSNNIDEGIQRLVKINRLKNIASYLKEEDALFPNTILISFKNKVLGEIFSEDKLIKILEILQNNEYDEEINYLNELMYQDINIEDLKELKVDGYRITKIDICSDSEIYKVEIDSRFVEAQIIDGQHRLASFALARDYIDKFELPITAFFELAIFKQAELFSTINGEQKPVNKSLIYDLYNFKDDDDPKCSEIKRCTKIARAFNKAQNSPFRNKIKMTGTGEGSLSQAAFVDELMPYMKNRSIDRYKSVFRELPDSEVIIVLLKYFKCIRNNYKEAWDNSKEYVLTRTIGYGIIMKIFMYIFMKSYIDGQGRENLDFNKYIKTMAQITSFSVREFAGGSSQGIQTSKKNQILRKLFLDKEVDENKYTLDLKYKREIDQDLKLQLQSIENNYEQLIKL